MKKFMVFLLICILTVSGTCYSADIYDDEYYKYFEDEDYGVGLYKIFIMKDNEPIESFDMMNTTTQKLTVRPYPTKANGNVRWYSSNNEVACVDENGTVTAVGTGTCKIYAVSKLGSSKKDFVTVNVTTYIRKPDRISIAPEDSAVFETGNTVKFIPTFYPEDTTEKTLRWFSFGTAAIVNQDGVLTVKDRGKVKVRAVTLDGRASCEMEIDTSFSENHFKYVGKANNVKKNRSIVMEFDAPINIQSAYDNVFANMSHGGNGENIEIDVIVEGNRLIVKPKTVWNTGINYIFVKETLKDTGGNTLDKGYKYLVHVREG